MSTIHFHTNTTLSPEQFVAGLTDFGPERPKIFSKSAEEYLKVHAVGPHDADVTEGSGGAFERLHSDWANVNHCRGNRGQCRAEGALLYRRHHYRRAMSDPHHHIPTPHEEQQ